MASDSASARPSSDAPAPSHHRPGGGFRNPWPDSDLHGFKDFLRWRFVDRQKTRIAPNPPRGALPRRTPSVVKPRAARGYCAVTWVGHASTLVQLGALNVLTDPMWSERASPIPWIGPRRLTPPGLDFDALPPIDVVLLSHNHYDHLDAPTVRRIAKTYPDAHWICPLGLAELLKSFGVRRVDERDWWQTVEGPGYSATSTPARHFSARGLRDRGDTLWCGWTFASDDVRLYFAGDTALHPEFGAIAERCGPFDLVMLPIGAYEPRWFMNTVHMNPEDAIEAYRALRPSNGNAPACLTIHWGSFRLTDEAVEEPPKRFADRWREAGFSPDLNWTLAIGETRRLTRGTSGG